MPLAAWMHFVRMRARQEAAIVDPLAAQLAAIGRQLTGQASHDLPRFFALPGVFPAALSEDPRLRGALAQAYEAITARGALGALAP